MSGGEEAWEDLYRTQKRPWRGVSDLGWTDIRPGTKVLDLGCGNGKTSEALLEMGASVTGIDFSPSAITSCEERLGHKGRFLVGDVRSLPFDDGRFDAATTVHVLENLDDDDASKASDEWYRVLRRYGRLYLQCFGPGDFRSGGRKEDVRNGISYYYRSVDEVAALFTRFRTVSLCERTKTTRFGEVRSVVFGIFEKERRCPALQHLFIIACQFH